MAKMECPICGKAFDEDMMIISDNGNLICCNCAEKETTNEKEKE